MKLRSYQTEALDAVTGHWAAGETRAAVVLPTGVGKTVIFSELTRRTQSERVLILVHREELVSQTVGKLHAMGVRDVGVVKAARNETGPDVVVATVQTLYGGRDVGPRGVVICDELHHFASKQNRQLLGRLGVLDGWVRAAGFTATFTRSDSAKLGNDWSVVMERDVQWAIEHGYLVDVEARTVVVPDLDLSGVRSSSGDFSDQSLGDAVSASSAAELIPAAWRKYAEGRPTILFAPSISSCNELARGLAADGITTETVFGHTPTADRQAIYDRLRNGATKVLASVGVLTEGFDVPAISCAIMARPTKSRGLWQQMAGRALRLFPGKDNAVLLDITGDALNHSLASITDLTQSKTESETKKTAPSLCLCAEMLTSSCCNVGELKTTCRANKARGLCHCDCICELAAEDESIELVRGEHDIEVDLFAGSTSVWLQTRAGVWFIPTAARLWFIARRLDTGTYSVGYTGTPYCVQGGGWLLDDLDQGSAMMITQEQATNEDPSVSSRDAGWRKRKASEQQMRLAQQYGLPVEDGMRKGPVSDLLSVYFATVALDREVGRYIAP
ncbi:MAG TPA: DEAD/DEAH box helicase [Thermoanaerobaculia bacterium]|nr:DEAD/DEAH box helicase [Thermoanaerobaculia bacterium]